MVGLFGEFCKVDWVFVGFKHLRRTRLVLSSGKVEEHLGAQDDVLEGALLFWAGQTHSVICNVAFQA